MKELYGRFFDAMHQFHRVRIGDLFPERTQGDCVTLLAINRFYQEKKDEMLTVSELAEKTHVKPSAVSRTLKNLEEQGLVERTINKSDRRNTYVTVTEHGREECEKMGHIMCDFAEAVLARMEEEDLTKLIDYMNELNQVATEEIEIRKAKINREE